MNQGTYKFKQQIGGKGAFALVTVEITEAEPPNQIFTVDCESVSQHYVSAAKTGIQYAIMQLCAEKQNPPNVNVRILEILETTADTREIMVVYAACMAMCDALNMHLQNPVQIDSTKRCISFPLGN